MERKINGVSFNMDALKEQSKLGKEKFFQIHKLANWVEYGDKDQLKLIEELWNIASEKQKTEK